MILQRKKPSSMRNDSAASLMSQWYNGTKPTLSSIRFAWWIINLLKVRQNSTQLNVMTAAQGPTGE